MRRALIAPLLLAAACRAPAATAPARDAAAEVSVMHVCYGAAGSAVEVPRSTPCASLGASELPPATVPPPPPPRRTRAALDAGTLF